MRKFIFIIISSAVLINSCIKEKFDSLKFSGSIDFTPGIAVPIGYAHMSLQKYLNDSNLNKGIIVGKDGLITILYREKIFSVYAMDFYNIPDQTASITIDEPGPAVLKTGQSTKGDTVSYTEFFQLLDPSSGMHLDSISLKTGQISIQPRNTMQVEGSYSISFPGIRVGNSFARITNTISSELLNLDLSNKTIMLTSHDGQDNFLEMDIKIVAGSIGSSSPGNPLIEMELASTNIQYSVLYGYVDEASIPINKGSFALNFYQRLIQGNFYFSDPKLKLLFTNSIGLPFEIYFNSIRAYTKIQDSTFIAGPGVPGSAMPRSIRYPSRPGDTAKDEITLDTINSNLGIVMAREPVKISFDMSDLINPGSSKQIGFITDSSRLEADLEVELPLRGHTDPFLLIEDSINFQFTSGIYKNLKEVQFVQFELNVTNDFPVSITPQVYFTNDVYNVIDSLITDSTNLSKYTIPAASVDGNGIPSPKKSDPIYVKFTPERIAKIQNATHIITRGRIVSSGATQKDVKFLNGSFLDFNLGLIVQLQVNTSL